MGNMAVISLLAQWFEEQGFDTSIMPVAGCANKANLLATLGSGEGGLLLSGHTDTVPYDDKGWNSDPFQLCLRDEKLFGLGTTDMKAFLLLALFAAKKFKASDLKRPLHILATADEESTMSGAKALARQSIPLADCAIIGEPTGLKPIRMHKGIFMEKIKLTGISGHSSDPQNGISALEGMRQVLNALDTFRQSMQAKYHHQGFVVPVPTLNLGHIHGGDNPNRICGYCECAFDLRPLPGMDIHLLRQQLHETIDNVLAQSGLKIEYEVLFDGIPAMETAAESDIVQFLQQQSGEVADSVAFATEAPYLQALGMDVVVMGPGDIALAHQCNEYLHGQYIDKTISWLQNTIAHYCVEANHAN